MGTKEEINNFDEIIQQLKNTENINKTGFLLADTNELLLNNKDGIDSLENLPKTELKTEEIDEIIQLVEKSKIATKNNYIKHSKILRNIFLYHFSASFFSDSFFTLLLKKSFGCTITDFKDQQIAI